MSPLDGIIGLLQTDLEAEGLRLFSWWSAMDRPNVDGFLAEVESDGVPNVDADQSVILATRLLWYFSAHGRVFKSEDSSKLASKAARILQRHFWDLKCGGLFWSLTPTYEPNATHKQAYAQAFGIYAFSEYYALTGDPDALRMALELFDILERHYRDRDFGGYREALSQTFDVIEDQRLSDKDMNAPKSMNTHLHVLEAYGRLHQIAPSPASAEALSHVIDMFLINIVDEDKGHLRLFFSDEWGDLSHHVSFGHDIEASWLLYEAAEVLNDPQRLRVVRSVALELAEVVAVQGVGSDGGVFYEAALEGGAIDPTGEWWGQAEGLVGFLNAFELTGNEAYLRIALSIWSFVNARHKPDGRGEWTWYPSGSGRANPYLAGAWKCPYHNGRAMMEALDRLGRLVRKGDRVVAG